jgi:hypothetical protein
MPETKHIAILRFKESVTAAQADAVMDELRELRNKISQIKSFSGGVNTSPEGLNKGLTHGFVMTFASAADRDAYLIHPEHEKIKARAIPLVEDIIVFDFEDSGPQIGSAHS